MGLRYTSYRVHHELEKRLGVLKKKHPINPIVKKNISFDEWKKLDIPFTITARENFTIQKQKNELLKDSANKIFNGEISFFNSDWKNLGLNYDWITNPETNFQYDISKHWSEINDFNSENGDIKYVWEKSRFTHLLTIIRYDYHFDEDHASFVFNEIENWIDSNPINQGPNWKCSQEISLRLFNWMHALIFYKNSSFLTEDIFNKIQNVMYWTLHHIYQNINFSRIAVRNNHAITETLALTLSEILFPFLPDAKKWSKDGRKWLEREVKYQVYNDGTFLQFSMNYHRVLIQLFSFGISITEKGEKPFSKTFYDRAYKSLNFLYQCLQKENGNLPNYGANDGALFFPLTNSKYRDYRPQLNTLHKILTGFHLFEEYNVLEDYKWVQDESRSSFPIIIQEQGKISFKDGGYYLNRSNDSFTFIRCGKHKDRPSHSDNLHIDIWVKGENILRDSGTYKYNTEKELSDYFTGSKAHNTVVVNNESQMLKGSRFIWYYWTQAIEGNWKETNDYYIFKGKIKVYQFLNPKGVHVREVKISKKENTWIINDSMKNLDGYSKEQLWHFDKFKINIESKEKGKRISSKKINSFNSEYYGIKEEGQAISFSFNSEIETKIHYITK